MEQNVKEAKKTAIRNGNHGWQLSFSISSNIERPGYLLKFLSAASISMGAVCVSAELPLGSVS